MATKKDDTSGLPERGAVWAIAFAGLTALVLLLVREFGKKAARRFLRDMTGILEQPPPQIATASTSEPQSLEARAQARNWMKAVGSEIRQVAGL